MRRKFVFRCWRGHRSREHWAGNCIVCHREGVKSPVGMYEIKFDYSGARGPVPGKYRAHDWQTWKAIDAAASCYRERREAREREKRSREAWLPGLLALRARVRTDGCSRDCG